MGNAKISIYRPKSVPDDVYTDLTLALRGIRDAKGLGPAEGSRPGLTQDYFFTRSHLLSDSGWKACSAGMVATGFM